MKRGNLNPKAFFSTLSERAGSIIFARSDGLPTFNTQTKLAPLSSHKAGVLIGNFPLPNWLTPSSRRFVILTRSSARRAKRPSGSVSR